MFDDLIFIVQPYVAKPHRLVAQPAQLFAEEAEAKRVARRLARYRAGVVVMAQRTDVVAGPRPRPHVLATHGAVPDGWLPAKAA